MEFSANKRCDKVQIYSIITYILWCTKVIKPIIFHTKSCAFINHISDTVVVKFRSLGIRVRCSD